MKDIIKSILRKRISDSDKIKKIKEFLNEDNTKKLGINNLVLLSDEEKHKLYHAYGKKIVIQKIQDLDSYMYRRGVKYKDHYRTIIKWIQKEGIQKIKRKTFICSFGIEHPDGICDCM